MPPPQLQSAPQEDISVVMGRFHAWDTARQKPAASNTAAEGVRELSYEEALAYSHPKRPVRNPQPGMPPAASSRDAHNTAAQAAAAPLAATLSPQQHQHLENAAKAAPVKPPMSVKNSRKRIAKPVHKPAPTVATTPAVQAAAAAKSQPRKAVATRKSATAAKPAEKTVQRSAKKSDAREQQSVDGAAVQPRKPAKSAGKTPATQARKPLKAGTKAPQPNIGPRQSSTFQSALATCLKESPRSGASPKTVTGKKSSAKKPMARAHAETRAASAQADKTIPRKPVESIARTISVNLRLSKAEHDRMRRGASEADLSLATFIRESTLRYQISREREQKSTQDPRSHSSANGSSQPLDDESFDRPIVESEGPGLLARIRSFWLGRRLTAVA